MVKPAGRRTAMVVLLALLVGAVGIAALPLGIPAVRVLGMSVLWWYAGVLAPIVAAAAAAMALLARRSPEGTAPAATDLEAHRPS